MNSKKLYYLLVSCLVVLVVAIGGIAYGANKLLGMRASVLDKLKADAQVAATAQDTLISNKKDIKKYQELDTIARTIVPQDKDQAEAVREIVNLAGASGLPRLSSITFPQSTLGTVRSPSAAANSKPTQVKAVEGIPGVYDFQITISQDQKEPVPYDRFLTFLGKLEQNRRTAQVSSINVQPNRDNANLVSFTLVIDEFIKP